MVYNSLQHLKGGKPDFLSTELSMNASKLHDVQTLKEYCKYSYHTQAVAEHDCFMHKQ